MILEAECPSSWVISRLAFIAFLWELLGGVSAPFALGVRCLRAREGDWAAADLEGDPISPIATPLCRIGDEDEDEYEDEVGSLCKVSPSPPSPPPPPPRLSPPAAAIPHPPRMSSRRMASNTPAPSHTCPARCRWKAPTRVTPSCRASLSD